MATVNGCDLPEDVFYNLEKHTWARLLDDGTVRLGMTSVAGKLAGGTLAAVTVSARKVGKEIAAGKSVATVESSKYVGPVPTPVSGTLLRGNDRLVNEPNLAVSDPYGDGWIAEMTPSDWDGESPALPSGAAGVAAYQAWLEAEGVSCT
ncbi:MAG: glycine cleavage system protein H [Acidimicrobiia bacterium]